MRTQSVKAKGRRLQQWVCAQILKRFEHLEEDDVQSRGMGGAGEDVMLSPAARRAVPISSECKNQESLSIWAAMKQAEANAGDYVPVLFFKRNRSREYACLPAEDLLDLYLEVHQLKEGRVD